MVSLSNHGAVGIVNYAFHVSLAYMPYPLWFDRLTMTSFP
ncbi:MAG: hypothetical protein JWP44_3228 [Mucilaginibacter sp.]|nr:hypothetical protein [Mucilaginibacter sp.]